MITLVKIYQMKFGIDLDNYLFVKNVNQVSNQIQPPTILDVLDVLQDAVIVQLKMDVLLANQDST